MNEYFKKAAATEAHKRAVPLMEKVHAAHMAAIGLERKPGGRVLSADFESLYSRLTGLVKSSSARVRKVEEVREAYFLLLDDGADVEERDDKSPWGGR